MDHPVSEPGARALVTRSSLVTDLQALGLGWGNVVCVHASLRALGQVCGGPVAVVQALLDVVGRHGTVVVPTHTPGNSEPSRWSRPAVPAEWWPRIRAEMPGFHPRMTPSEHMGVVAELVRTWPGAKRSDHPQLSFAAVGDRAEELTARHRLAPGFGDGTPMGRLTAAGGRVLLLGVGYDSASVLHVAEQRTGRATTVEHGAATQGEGNRRWVTWTDLDHDADDFAALGASFEITGAVSVGRVGAGVARLFRAADAVAFGERWLTEHRP
ncbi:MAG: aminoglycoside N(3)-acetyltransferase [Mycobacteriales bacterium]